MDQDKQKQERDETLERVEKVSESMQRLINANSSTRKKTSLFEATSDMAEDELGYGSGKVITMPEVMKKSDVRFRDMGEPESIAEELAVPSLDEPVDPAKERADAVMAEICAEVDADLASESPKEVEGELLDNADTLDEVQEFLDTWESKLTGDHAGGIAMPKKKVRQGLTLAALRNKRKIRRKQTKRSQRKNRMKK